MRVYYLGAQFIVSFCLLNTVYCFVPNTVASNTATNCAYYK